MYMLIIRVLRGSSNFIQSINNKVKIRKTFFFQTCQIDSILLKKRVSRISTKFYSLQRQREKFCEMALLCQFYLSIWFSYITVLMKLCITKKGGVK